jgi:uncharacterized YigZ family protein
MIESYLTVKRESVYESVVSRSKFIGRSFYISDENDAAEKLKKLKSEYPQAAHYCYAYVLSPQSSVTKHSDDGEPVKTAGFPILEAVKSRGLYYTMAAVVRYFGGVKLGTGGLSRAYSDTALKVLDLSGVKKYVYCAVFEAQFDYAFLGAVGAAVENGGTVLERLFDSKVKITAAYPQGDYDKLKGEIMDITGGSAAVSEMGKRYIAV